MKQEYKKFIKENYQSLSSRQIAAKLGLREKIISNYIHKLKQNDKTKTVPQKQKAIKPLPKTKQSHWKFIITILLVGCAVYANALKGDFIWDDNILVVDNIEIKNLDNLNYVLTGNLGGEEFHRVHSSFRPLQTITYMLDYAVWELNALGYHLTNIILHLLVSLTVYGLIITIFANQRLAFLTALLYVVHPVHTEAVTYISGRADPLSTLFLLLAFTFYVKGTEHRWRYIIPLIMSFILALGARESALILIGLVIIYHLILKRKIIWVPLLTVLAVSGTYIVLRVTETLGQMGLKETASASLLDRIPGFMVALTGYAKMLIFPFHLRMEYGRPVFPWSNPLTIIGLCLLGFLIFIALRTRKQNVIISFGILWFIATILPVSNTLVIVNAFMAEHWLYLPSIGLFLILGLGLTKLYENEKYKKVSLALVIFFVAFMGVRTVQQNTYWREPISFFKRTLKYAPNSARAYSDLGYAYQKLGKQTEAIEAYEKTISLDPYYIDAYNNLGNAYTVTGQPEKAIETLIKAIKFSPDTEFVYYNLASAYYKIGQREKAVENFQKGLSISPKNLQANIYLGTILGQLGRSEEAIKVYKKALKYHPRSDDLYYRMGLMYKNTGKIQKARDSFQKSVSLNPNNADAHNNLGIMASYLGNHEDSSKHFQRAVQVNPKHQNAYSNLGVTLNNLGKKEEAIKAHQKAISINPGYEGAYNNLAVVFNSIGRESESIPLLEKAIQINPRYTAAYSNLGFAYKATGQPNQAIMAYQKVLEIDPQNKEARNQLLALKKEVAR